MTPNFQEQIDTIETDTLSLHKVDKKISLIIWQLTEIITVIEKFDKRIYELEKKSNLLKGWIAGISIAVSVSTFFFIKIWEKVFP